MGMRGGARAKEHAEDVARSDRNAERVALEVKVDFESDHNFYTGLTQNISAGGLFIANQIRRIGDRIKVTFSLPGSGAPVTVEAEVRWIRENSPLLRVEDGFVGMGVRFINLSPDAAHAIQKFIERRESLFYDDE